MSRLLWASLLGAALGLCCWWFGYVVVWNTLWPAVQHVVAAVWNNILLPLARELARAISTGKS